MASRSAVAAAVVASIALLVAGWWWIASEPETLAAAPASALPSEIPSISAPAEDAAASSAASAPASVAHVSAAVWFRDRARLALGGNPEQAFAFYQQARQAGADPGDRFLARQVGEICERVVAGMPWVDPIGRDGQARARQDAQARLKQACAGFYGIPPGELRRENLRLAKEIEADPWWSRDPQAFGDPALAPAQRAQQQLAQSMARYGPAVLLVGAGVLTDAWTRAADGTPDAERLQYWQGLTIAAPCEAGVPCGPDSLLYLNLCAHGLPCNGHLVDTVTEGLPAEQREHLRQAAGDLARQIRRQDFDAVFTPP